MAFPHFCFTGNALLFHKITGQNTSACQSGPRLSSHRAAGLVSFSPELLQSSVKSLNPSDGLQVNPWAAERAGIVQRDGVMLVTQRAAAGRSSTDGRRPDTVWVTAPGVGFPVDACAVCPFSRELCMAISVPCQQQGTPGCSSPSPAVSPRARFPPSIPSSLLGPCQRPWCQRRGDTTPVSLNGAERDREGLGII